MFKSTGGFATVLQWATHQPARVFVKHLREHTWNKRSFLGDAVGTGASSAEGKARVHSQSTRFGVVLWGEVALEDCDASVHLTMTRPDENPDLGWPTRGVIA